MSDDKTRTSAEVYQHGYLAGYNQCRVDKGEISQEEANKILQKALK